MVLFEGFVTLEVHAATVASNGFRPVRMAPDVAESLNRRLAANERWENAHPVFKTSFRPSQQAHDARPWVADLNMPILVFIGERGQELPSDPGGWREQLGMVGVSDLTVEVIPDAGHWMMLDDPRRVGKSLMRFLDRVAAKNTLPSSE